MTVGGTSKLIEVMLQVFNVALRDQALRDLTNSLVILGADQAIVTPLAKRKRGRPKNSPKKE